MSPPKVEIATKTLGAQDVEICQQRSKKVKKYSVIAGAIVFSAAIIAGAVLGGIALHHRLSRKTEYTASAEVDNRILKEHVHVDYKKEIIFVSNPEEGNINGLNALHDYGKKILAFKDTTVDRCFIDVLDQTFDEGLNQWKDFSTYNRVPPKREMMYVQEPIDKTVEKTFLGENIAEHCKDVHSHWIVELPEGIERSGSVKFNNHTVAFVCAPHTTMLSVRESVE